MGIITLKDGTKGYTYPSRLMAPYRHPKTARLGHAITPGYGATTKRIIRECYREYPGSGGSYWVADELPDGSLGAMYIQSFTSHELEQASPAPFRRA